MSGRVTAKTSGCPDFQGAVVTPSDQLSSECDRPVGSKIDGIQATIKDLLMKLFMLACQCKMAFILGTAEPISA